MYVKIVSTLKRAQSYAYFFSLGQWFIGRNLNPRIGLFDIKTFKCASPVLFKYLAMFID